MVRQKSNATPFYYYSFYFPSFTCFANIEKSSSLPSRFFQVALRCKPYVSLVLFSSVVCLPYFYICLHLPTSPPPSFRSYLIFFKASKTINKKSTYEKRVLSWQPVHIWLFDEGIERECKVRFQFPNLKFKWQAIFVPWLDVLSGNVFSI